MRPGRVNYLEGLRGIAAMQVVLLHFVTGFLPDTADHAWPPLHILFDGHTAVYVFFLISGAVLTPSFARPGNVAGKVAKRVVRLGIPVAAAAAIATAVATAIGRAITGSRGLWAFHSWALRSAVRPCGSHRAGRFRWSTQPRHS